MKTPSTITSPIMPSNRNHPQYINALDDSIKVSLKTQLPFIMPIIILLRNLKGRRRYMIRMKKGFNGVTDNPMQC